MFVQSSEATGWSPERVVPSSCRRLGGICWDGAWLWCADPSTGTLAAISSAGNTRRRILVPHLTGPIAHYRRTLFVMAGSSPELHLVSRAGNDIRRWRVPGNPDVGGVAVNADHLFFAVADAILSYRLSDFGAGPTYPGPSAPGGLFIGPKAFWVTLPSSGVLRRVSRVGGVVKDFFLGGEPVGLAFDRRGRLWVGDRASGLISQYRADAL